MEQHGQLSKAQSLRQLAAALCSLGLQGASAADLDASVLSTLFHLAQQPLLSGSTGGGGDAVPAPTTAGACGDAAGGGGGSGSHTPPPGNSPASSSRAGPTGWASSAADDDNGDDDGDDLSDWDSEGAHDDQGAAPSGLDGLQDEPRGAAAPPAQHAGGAPREAAAAGPAPHALSSSSFPSRAPADMPLALSQRPAELPAPLAAPRAGDLVPCLVRSRLAQAACMLPSSSSSSSAPTAGAGPGNVGAAGQLQAGDAPQPPLAHQCLTDAYVIMQVRGLVFRLPHCLFFIASEGP